MIEGFGLLHRHLKEREEDLRNSIAGGAAQTMEDYRYMVGSLNEVVRLSEVVKDVERRFVDDE